MLRIVFFRFHAPIILFLKTFQPLFNLANHLDILNCRWVRGWIQEMRFSKKKQWVFERVCVQSFRELIVPYVETQVAGHQNCQSEQVE